MKSIEMIKPLSKILGGEYRNESRTDRTRGGSKRGTAPQESTHKCLGEIQYVQRMSIGKTKKQYVIHIYEDND
jgi:hypothetical protein